MTLTPDFHARFGWPAATRGHVQTIGHRGASGHAVENTLRAFRVASQMGAGMWELDVRLTKDGICVVSHDDHLAKVFGIDATISTSTLAELRAAGAADLPTFADTLDLAMELGTGLYIEIKGDGAGPVAWRQLQAKAYRFAGLGSFITHHVRELRDMGCDYPLASLIRVGADPFAEAEASGADIIHLCWERASDTPQTFVTPELIETARAKGLEIVLWHEERPAVIADLLKLPVIGICTDQPELFDLYRPSADNPIRVCCHRGANRFAPENTLAAARICLDRGLGYVEFDVRQSSDGVPMVIHDAKVDRTTSGTGPVADKTLAELKALDAGSWFSPFHAGERLPTLAEMLALVKPYADQGLYVELKAVDPQRMLDVINDAGMFDRCFFWSFDAALLAEVGRLAPTARMMFRRVDFASLDAMFAAVKSWVVEFELDKLDPADVVHCRALGARVMIQYFGDDEAAFARLIGHKPDLVNIDRADIFTRVYGRLQAEGNQP